MNKFKQTIAAIFICMATLLTASSVLANQSPSTTVESLVKEVIAVLKDSGLNDNQRFDALNNAIDGAIDRRAMAQSVLGRLWRQITETQQQEFEGLLNRTLKNTYINRLDAYNNEVIEYGQTQIREDRAQVETTIITSSGRLPVNYRLRQKSDGWFIYDVIVDNVSLVTSYRESYRNIVLSSGMDDLLEQMREKLAEIEQ